MRICMGMASPETMMPRKRESGSGSPVPPAMGETVYVPRRVIQLTASFPAERWSRTGSAVMSENCPIQRVKLSSTSPPRMRKTAISALGASDGEGMRNCAARMVELGSSWIHPGGIVSAMPSETRSVPPPGAGVLMVASGASAVTVVRPKGSLSGPAGSSATSCGASDSLSEQAGRRRRDGMRRSGVQREARGERMDV